MSVFVLLARLPLRDRCQNTASFLLRKLVSNTKLVTWPFVNCVAVWPDVMSLNVCFFVLRKARCLLSCQRIASVAKSFETAVGCAIRSSVGSS